MIKKLLAVMMLLASLATIPAQQGMGPGPGVKSYNGGASSLSTKASSFTLNTSTGNQSVTGLGFQPKAILFFYNLRNTDGTSGSAIFGMGVGISSGDRRATVTRSTDGQTASVNFAANQSTTCIYFPAAAVTADFVSADADGFTINITATDGSDSVINYLALGGTALTNFKTGVAAAKTSTGTQAYTGVGFQPTCLIFFAGKVAADPLSSTTSGNGMIGFATSSTSRGMVAWRAQNNVNPSVVRHRQTKTRVFSTTTVFTEADFVSFDSDGFTLNFNVAGGAADNVYYLALSGPQFKASAFNQATSTGNQAITGAGFTPKASLMISANDVAANDNVVGNGFGISVGIATGTSNRANLWIGDTDNVSPTVAKHTLDRTKVMKMITVGSTPTVNAEADHVSFDSDGQTINWSTVDATAREILVLWIG